MGVMRLASRSSILPATTKPVAGTCQCRSPVTSAPLSSPHSSPIPQATTTATGRVFHADASSEKFCSTYAVPNAESAKIDPTEMSIPPAMITHVTPTAMIA